MKRLILILVVGFSTSQALAQWQAPNNVQQFNPYISTAPVAQYEELMRQKQIAYDNNVKSIQNMIDKISNLESFLRTNGYESLANGLNHNTSNEVNFFRKSRIDWGSYDTFSYYYNRLVNIYNRYLEMYDKENQ